MQSEEDLRKAIGNIGVCEWLDVFIKCHGTGAGIDTKQTELSEEQLDRALEEEYAQKFRTGQHWLSLDVYLPRTNNLGGE